MIHQQYLMDQVYLVDLLLNFLPFCNTEDEQFEILEEVGRIRNIITQIEELTKTERQRDLKFRIMTIESSM